MLALRDGEDPRGDEGVTLIEVMVAMVLMAFAMAIFTGGIVEIHRWVDKTDASFEAQGQMNATYARLDKEVRYARSVSDPAQVNGDWYVEYLVSLDSVDTCVELRLSASAQELQRREWAQNVTPVAPTSWQTLATGVSGSTPFTTVAADKNSPTGFRFQRLQLNVGSTVGVGSNASTRQTNVTFTALNATQTLNSSTCIAGRSVSS
ncbi:prepilin-type N-terminal cleavage/methylation domain-containing protein [Actinoplanes sp. NPDC051513]|uniref:prepilin-type N-terminal cleavage/methylation domain-containing protein n=1 Tax=Actinoplanes sp. NPDC051513 TaxID=3363908 RepID=UPI0037A64147